MSDIDDIAFATKLGRAAHERLDRLEREHRSLRDSVVFTIFSLTVLLVGTMLARCSE